MLALFNKHKNDLEQENRCCSVILNVNVNSLLHIIYVFHLSTKRLQLNIP